MEYIVLFFTISGAMKFERKCKKGSIQCELMPVPRSLSSNCSISAKVGVEDSDSMKNLIDDEIEKIFSVQGNDHKLVYESE